MRGARSVLNKRRRLKVPKAKAMYTFWDVKGHFEGPGSQLPGLLLSLHHGNSLLP